MRRENRQPSRRENRMKTTMYIGGGIIFVAVLAFTITYFAYSNKLKKESLSRMDMDKIAQLIPSESQDEEESTKSASSQIGKSIDEVKEEQADLDIPKIAINTSTMISKEETEEKYTKKEDTRRENEQTKENKQKEETKKEMPDPTFAKPVEGEICKEFAKDNLVYSETLNEWTTHLGIDIKAENTTVVKASAEGKVKAIKNDPRYGLTVIIEHSNGFISSYSNLLTSEFVVEGEEVKQGQTIGTVGSSAVFEITDESHLHFEILKDNVNVDPSLYLK